MYMAMSEKMSNTSPGGDSLVQYYRTTSATTMFSDRVSDATLVSTTHFSSSPHGSSTTTNPGGPSHLNPEGRVSKPIRRRSRASRRTPTTLLNTDTTNFRAMVQQFTGGPSAPFAFGSHPPGGATNFNLGLGARQVVVNPMPSGSYHHLRFNQQEQLHQQQQQQHRHQQPPYMFFGNSRPSMEMNVAAGGFGVEGIGPAHAPPPRPPSSGDFNSNNYML